MSSIYGTYSIKIEDGTGRFRLPGDLVDIYGDTVWLYIGDGPFVRLYTTEQRNKLIEALSSLDPLEIDDNRLWQLREMGSSMIKAEIKGKGRITLPQTYREHAGFNAGDEIVLIGCVQFAELWKSKDAFDAERKRHREQKLIRGR